MCSLWGRTELIPWVVFGRTAEVGTMRNMMRDLLLLNVTEQWSSTVCARTLIELRCVL